MENTSSVHNGVSTLNKSRAHYRKPKRGKVWISPDIFDVDLKPQGWSDDPDLRRGVDWLLSFVEKDAWHRRRFAALQHFIDSAAGSSPDPSGRGRFFDDKDRFAWYLFLGQAFLDHPTIYDFMYGSRVVPVLTAIGRDVDLLKGVAGVEDRILRMVTSEKAQPNACLFELLVAAAYRRAGASVTFLNERPGLAKTHDMEVLLDGTQWAVECKRMEGGEYSEDERREARALWLPVGRALHQKGLNVLCTADFRVEMNSVPRDYLSMKASQWLSSGGLFPLTWSDAISAGKIERLNLRPLQKLLATDHVALNSSRLIELLTGKYKRNARVITALNVKRSDNPLYIDACDGGIVFDWDCHSDAAIDKRARDVLKRISEGCRQLPDGRPGVVHVGFEAVDGMEVEAVRYRKIMNSLAQFDPKGKALEYVYVNWLAPESPPDTAMALDETCHWHGIRPTRPRPLDSGFLMLSEESEQRTGVHWRPERPA